MHKKLIEIIEPYLTLERSKSQVQKSFMVYCFFLRSLVDFFLFRSLVDILLFGSLFKFSLFFSFFVGIQDDDSNILRRFHFEGVLVEVFQVSYLKKFKIYCAWENDQKKNKNFKYSKVWRKILNAKKKNCGFV